MNLPACLLLALSLVAETVTLTPQTVVTFATTERGAELLADGDDHIAAMSEFDRQARVGAGGSVSDERMRELYRTNVLSWLPDEKRKLTERLNVLRPLLARFELTLPQNIILVKTSGREEGGALYTRRNAVVLTENVVNRVSGIELDRLLLHEIFHVFSRNSPAVTESLYAAIGFRRCGSLELPAALAARRISNPDISATAYSIRVSHDGREIEVAPIIYAAVPYDPERGGTFFEYMKLRLLEVERQGPKCVPVRRNESEVLLQPDAVGGFFEQIGRNTEYVTDPQEILADNFVLLVQGRRDVPSPEVIKRMADILAKRAAGDSSATADRR